MQPLSFFNTKYFAVISLGLIWLLVQGGLYFKYGAQTSVDSTVYIDDAHRILSGYLPEGRSTWYLGYSTFLALIFSLNGTITTVVIIQIILSGFASIALYILAKDIFNNKPIAWLTVLFYLLWIKIHQWNTFVYTESLFISFTILSFAVLVKSKNGRQYLLSIVLILYTFFIRPTGFPFIVALAWYVIKSFPYYVSRKAAIVILCGMVASFFVLMNTMLTSYTLVDSYVKGEIIYPDITMGIIPPPDLSWSDINSPILQLVSFIIHNPLYFLKLFSLKLVLFLGNVKPYFSHLHNVMIVAILYPLYFFAIRGYKDFPLGRHEKHFIVSYVLLQSLIVGFTSENWDGRFLVPLLPFIFMLSAAGIAKTFQLKPNDRQIA